MPQDKAAARIIQLFQSLSEDISTWQSRWDECSYYCLPEEWMDTWDVGGGGADADPKGDRREAPSDGTAVRAAERLASGLFSNTIAQGQEWFAYRSIEEAANDDQEVADWLNNAADICLKAIQNSNHAQIYHEALIKLAVFGTGLVYEEEGDDGRLVFSEFPVAACRLIEGPDGRVNQIYRKCRMSAQQMADRWGEDALGRQARVDLADDQAKHKKREVIHAVHPRARGAWRDDTSDPMQYRYASFYVDVEDEHVLAEGGYRTFPFQTPRFYKSSDECYGRSPAMRAMPDVRTANSARSDYLHGVEQGTYPPVFLPDGGMRDGAVSMLPGAINYYDATVGQPIFATPQVNLGQVAEYLLGSTENIREAFYVDLFMMLEGQRPGNMTATEVNERMNEKIQAITPVIARLQAEYFAPMLERVLDLMMRAGRIPPAPAVLVESGYEPVYTTRLDAKLAQVEVLNLRRTVAEATEIAAATQQAPIVGAWINTDRAVRMIAEANNVDTKVLRTQDEVDELREEEEAAQAQAAQAQMAQSMMQPIDAQRAPEENSAMDLLTRDQNAFEGLL